MNKKGKCDQKKSKNRVKGKKHRKKFQNFHLNVPPPPPSHWKISESLVDVWFISMMIPLKDSKGLYFQCNEHL